MEKFLEELAELSKKYKIGIGGCGCCGTPFLYNLECGTIIGSELELTEDLKSYEVDIVRADTNNILQ